MLMKKKLLKKIILSKKLPLEIRKFANMDQSIYVEIPTTNAELEFTMHDHVADMAFEDIMVTRDSVFVKNDVEETLHRGVLLHIFRLSSEAIGIGLHVLDAGTDTYILVTAYEFNHVARDVKVRWTPPSYKPHAERDMKQAIVDSLLILEKLRNYERVVKTDSLPHSIMKLPKFQRETYVEYVVDLSKPITVSSVSGGGSHASPREHLRRGHYRTTRSGVRYFVRSTVVNEGSKGKVDKEYKV